MALDCRRRCYPGLSIIHQGNPRARCPVVDTFLRAFKTSPKKNAIFPNVMEHTGKSCLHGSSESGCIFRRTAAYTFQVFRQRVNFAALICRMGEMFTGHGFPSMERLFCWTAVR